jgi:hypothetical protein
MSETGRTPTIQLLAQEYAEVVAALQAATDGKGHERRTAARMEVQAQVKVTPFRDGEAGKSFTVLTRDLSFRGVGLLQGRQSARGSQFVIHLPRREGEAPLGMMCTVMFCRELADGLFNIGASFNSHYDPNAKPVAELRRGGGAGVATSEAEMDRIRQSILR